LPREIILLSPDPPGALCPAAEGPTKEDLMEERVSVPARRRDATELFDELRERIDELEERFRAGVNDSYRQGMRDERERWSYVDGQQGP
jgi:predicted phage gp36 major capsid-like protein